MKKIKRIFVTLVLLVGVRTLAGPADQGALAFHCLSKVDAQTEFQLSMNDDHAILHLFLAQPTQALHLEKTQENENLAVYSGFLNHRQNQMEQRMMTIVQTAFHPISGESYDMHVMYLVGNDQSAQSVDDAYSCVAL